MADQGDVLLYQTVDDGNISIEGGVVALSGGLQTAAYLSLFGGNEQDDGRKESSAQWWGNLGEPVEKQQRSETQFLIASIPAAPVNLRRVEDAARRDLSWLVSSKAASRVTAEASMPRVNTVSVLVTIEADGGVTELEFVENWKLDS